MTLHALSDEELLAALHAVHRDGRFVLARFVLHLVEIEERRLHLTAACSSMFDFCVRRLGMSEGAAFRRINAARLVRRFPVLVSHIESGAIHLSALVMLRDLLDEENVEELIAAASGKSKREVEELIARRSPKPDVPATLRRLPAASPSARDSVAPSTPGLASGMVTNPSGATSEQARFEPLAPARYKLQLTASAELRDKLERARALMRHRAPSGDLATVVEAAVDALLAKLEKERLGKTTRPRRQVDARAAQRGRVPRAVRRAVFERDGEQCTFVDDQGHRCPARALLELDHIDPRALSGADDAKNLRVLCRAHNRLHAEDVFGAAHVEHQIAMRQRKSRTPRAAPRSSASSSAPAAALAATAVAVPTAAPGAAAAGALATMAVAVPMTSAAAETPRTPAAAVEARAPIAVAPPVAAAPSLAAAASGAVARRVGRGSGRAEVCELATQEAHAVDGYELAARGLVNMGFREAQVRRALFTVDARHVDDAGGLPIEAVLREALAILT